MSMCPSLQRRRSGAAHGFGCAVRGAGAGAGALDADPDEELVPDDEALGLDADVPPDVPLDGVADGSLWYP